MIRIMCGRWCWTRRLLSTRRLLGGKAAVPGKGKGESGVGPCCCYPRVCMRGECLQGGGGGGGGARDGVWRGTCFTWRKSSSRSPCRSWDIPRRDADGQRRPATARHGLAAPLPQVRLNMLGGADRLRVAGREPAAVGALPGPPRGATFVLESPDPFPRQAYAESLRTTDPSFSASSKCECRVLLGLWR